LAQAEKYHAGLERGFELLAAHPRAARERDGILSAGEASSGGEPTSRASEFPIQGDDIPRESCTFRRLTP
jgi:plasmid stabilization system protein ParE